jgi:hypothetical protein
VLERLGKHRPRIEQSSPNWHEVRPAILSAFYEAKIKRG